MSERHSDIPTLPAELSVKSVLGLGQADEVEWARLRGMQYSRLATILPIKILAFLVTTAIMIAIHREVVPMWALGGWAAAVAATVMWLVKVDRSLADVDRRKMTRPEMWRHAQVVAVAGLVWSAPLAWSAWFGAPGPLLLSVAVLGTLIVALTMVVAAAPIAVLIFTVLTCSVGIGAAYWLELYLAGLIVALFAATVIAGTIRSAKTFLDGRVAEAAIAEKSEVVSLLLREFEENQADWLWQVDTNRRVRNVSPRFAYALGKSNEEVDGKSFLELIAGDAWENGQFPASLHDLAERLKRRENFSNLIVKVTINRENRWWELSGTPILDERGLYIGFRGVGSDVTEQRESSEKIAYLARYDTLTGLPNRLMLNEALGDAMRYAKQWRSRCAFLMIDLDRFKAVNDSLGHLIGDQLLAQVSKRLKNLMDENELVGRLGGDEFAIVIRDASESGCVEKVARRVIDKLSQPYEIDHHTLYVGASVGSAVAPRDGKTVEELMRNADLALYRSKDEGGGNHCQYEPTLHAVAEERRQLEFALRRALEREELVLNYQPVVDANDETLVSFEALVRWNSTDHGFVSPGKFIPLAEDTRLIVPIGEWVLEQSCREATNWPERVKVNVNVSGEQLVEPDFAATVVRALSNSGLEPHRLEIEVTESIFLRDADAARAALEQVMALGCSVALDDFGTGYSSLGYLRKLRFSTIKVDRSFVQGASENHAESLAIIRAVVAMAQSLEMTTTAEGVETPEQAAMIRDMGCTKIQGFYFGRPMPAGEARAIFRKNLREAG